jgi:pimeloyl-[acyl-carrier protein] methyl ester esterase
VATLVLLPGMDGTGKLFADFAAALPGSFVTVTVTYPPDRLLSYAELVELVRAACPAAEPFVLVAESFSTPLAIQYAATNPANLKGVVLVAGFASGPVRGWRRFLVRLLAPILFRMPPPDFAVRRWLVGRGASATLVAAVGAAVSSVRPKVMAERLRMVLSCDVQAEFGRVKVPMWCVQARQDRVVSFLRGEELRRMNPAMEVAVIDGPHLLLQREPEKAAELVAEFGERVGAG